MDMKKRRKIWREPIQARAEGVWVGRSIDE